VNWLLNSCPRPKKLRSLNRSALVLVDKATDGIKLQESRTFTNTSTESVVLGTGFTMTSTLLIYLWVRNKRSDSSSCNISKGRSFSMSKKFRIVPSLDLTCKLFPVFSSQLLAVSVESLKENPKGSWVSICICLIILPSYIDTSCATFWLVWLLRFGVVDLKISLCRNLVDFLFLEYDSIFL